MSQSSCSGADNPADDDHRLSCSCQHDADKSPSDGLFKSNNELQVPIYIETLTGTTFEVQVWPTDTISAIKNKLQDVEGIPVAEQHLIWQEEELRNDFSLEEYGIGFGTILKLIVRLRGGPIAKSPTLLDNEELFGIPDEEENSFADGDCLSRPVTVLLVHSGDRIKLVTLSKPTLKDEPDEEAVQNSSPSYSMLNLEKIFDGGKDEHRQKEDEMMKIKMQELQSKMQRLALKRSKNRNKLQESDKLVKSDAQNNNMKLPMIGPDTCRGWIQKRNHQKVSGVHLPPIELKAKPATTNSVENGSTNTNSLFLNRNSIYLKRVFSPKISYPLKRTRSLTLNRVSALKMLLLNEYANLRPLQLGSFEKAAKTRDNSLTFELASILTVDLIDSFKKRPSTTPFVSKINFPVSDVALAKELSPTRRKTNFNEINNLHYNTNQKLSSPAKLPPLKNKSQKSARRRCWRCRKRLTVASVFQCRCGHSFCAAHRYSEAHNCSFDYKTQSRRLLQLANPLVAASKISKI